MLNRRQFTQLAAAAGATLAMGCADSRVRPWVERRELYPQGVASGDPQPDSVILWTRRAPITGDKTRDYLLTLEVAADSRFEKIVSRAEAAVTAATDFTARFLVVKLDPATEYWYRFTDEEGHGSRIGRTLTAPAETDARSVRFTFVSCQDITQGANNAWRRMIFEDEKRSPENRLGFVMHLGDFVYEVVDYSEDSKDGRRYNRKLNDLVRYPDGEKLHDFHIARTLEDYRTLYRTYLQDQDLQDARARWPFVPVWDNHEFSWLGYQGMQFYDGKERPAQTKKVFANQAWWEYQPARVAQPKNGIDLKTFTAPALSDVPIEKTDAEGFGDEPNNRAAVASLKINRAFRYGKNMSVILTDNRSHKNADADGSEFAPGEFSMMVDEDAARIIDDGRNANGGKPPATLHFGGKDIPNPGLDQPTQTYLGSEQRAWLIKELTTSPAPWKIWGHSFGTLNWRTDLQNLPKHPKLKWPGAGFGLANGGYYADHTEIFDAVRAAGVTGLAIVAGDKHSFWAGFATKDLPPRAFDPVGVEFITGSISALGLAEVAPFRFKQDDPVRPLYLAGTGDKTLPAMNFLILHGVRSALALSKDPDPAKARALRNPEVAPHLSFADFGGHGYSMVTVTSESLETEFVCIPDPVERAQSADGGPLRYRVSHRVALWNKGERPKLEQKVLEGNADYSI